jgi:dUTP pyrophosphatase
MVTFKVKRLHEDATIPSYANPTDAAVDLHSIEDYTLKKGERKTFPLGFQAEFSPGHVAHVWDKSGLAAKHGIKTMAGVIDAGYRGEYKVVLLNTSDNDYEIKKGDKIAQLLIIPIPITNIIETIEDLDDSARGEGGFGSTGK